MNIIKIADLAGVSKSTVSRYLNNGYVSEEAREKIKKVIEETGFVPKRQAQAMRLQKTNLIGVIVPKISTETAARVIEGITNELSEVGYEVLIGNTNLSIEKEMDYLKVFKNQVDGIIFMATEVTPKHYELFDQLSIPLVVIAQKVKHYPCIIHDDYHAAKDAIHYLINKGHQSIGFIGVGEYDEAVGIDRKKGYLDALKEHQMQIKEEYIQIGDFSHESAFCLTEKLMNLPHPPTAIFAVTDNLAIGCMEYLNENNYQIPKDVAVMGLGDIKISAYMSPPLTTIHYHFQTMGAKSAKLLTDMIKAGKLSSKNCESNFIFNYRLMERRSV